MKNSDIIKLLELIYPASLACEWDNTGFLAGCLEDEFKGVFIALDATRKTVDEAIERGCSLLVTHHPLLFSPIRSVTDETLQGELIMKMIKNGLSCYSMHTSFDKASGGMADSAAKLLGLSNCEPICEADGDGSGTGRIGELAKPVSVRELARIARNVFRLDAAVLYSLCPEAKVKRVAVLPGSGRSQWTDALRLGAEVYITGDMNYHSALDAMQAGLSIIDAGHDGVEKLFVEEVAGYISEKIHRSDLVYSQHCHNIAEYI